MVQAVLDRDEAVISVDGLHKSFGGRNPVQAVRDVSFEVPRGDVVGLLGPDGAGKTSVIQILAGVSSADGGSVHIRGTDVLQEPERVKTDIGYMPQGLGGNLYDRLSVKENIDFFRGLRDLPEDKFQSNVQRLLEMTRLSPFMDREVRNLSGGMRQKLALICTLLHFPDILLLDEPTTGVDPISRQDFWRIIHDLVKTGDVTILLATSYMGEAERCQRILFMHEGKLLDSGSPDELRSTLSSTYVQIETDRIEELVTFLQNDSKTRDVQRTGRRLTVVTDEAAESLENRIRAEGISIDRFHTYRPGLEEVFIDRIGKKAYSSPVSSPDDGEPSRAVSEMPLVTRNVTKTFDGFTAVDQVSLNIEAGEVFGLLGPNGAGKTTLIKMMVGLLEVSDGELELLGEEMHFQNKSVQQRIGYMAQNFSLYEDLTIQENLDLFAGLYEVGSDRVEQVLSRLRLSPYLDDFAGEPPAGIRQRVGLACSLLHRPPLLFLDEPTSGVDPVARRSFWNLIYHLSRNEHTTILITTHYMAEADMCDRLALMNRGRIVASDPPRELKNRAQELGGQVLSVDTDAFRTAFERLDETFDRVTLFGNRIHVRTNHPERDAERIRDLLKAKGVSIRALEQTTLTMEEAFVDFIESEEN